MATSHHPPTTERDTLTRPDSGTGPGHPIPSGTPGPIAAMAGMTFAALSRLRGARIFHPRGVGYNGTLRIEPTGHRYEGVPLLERPGEHPAIFRFSRGAGLPEPLPDVLGLALRLPDVHGRGRHQDFLLVTSVDAPLLHHLLLPGIGGFSGQSFSSVLPYRVGGNLRLVGAQPTGRRLGGDRGALRGLTEAADRGDLNFRLVLASIRGRWSPVGELHVAERLSNEEAEELAFTPWNSGGGIRPTGPLMGVRRGAYRGSQRARGLRVGDIP
jgi:hypothetical protein